MPGDATLKTVAVLGWLGHQNFGDDLFVKAYQEMFAGWDIKVYSNSPTATYPLINFDEVNKCDLFVLGGGELINKTRLFLLDAWSHKISIPKIILGCGVNTQYAKQLSLLVIRELEQYSFIGVRDIHSLKILRSFPSLKDKVELFYDLAFALDVAKFAVPVKIDERWGFGPKVKPLCAVVIPTDRNNLNRQSDRGIKEVNLIKTSSKWLKNQLAPYAHTVFIPFGKEDNHDGHTCCELFGCSGIKENTPYIRKSAEIIHDEDISLELVARRISEASIVFTYRLHGLILAFMLKRNYVFYPYHHKLSNMQETLIGPPEAIKAWQMAIFNTLIKNQYYLLKS